MPLGYLNTRILQMHDVWHLMGPFDFLAAVVGKTAFDGGAGAGIMLDRFRPAA